MQAELTVRVIVGKGMLAVHLFGALCGCSSEKGGSSVTLIRRLVGSSLSKSSCHMHPLPHITHVGEVGYLLGFPAMLTPLGAAPTVTRGLITTRTATNATVAMLQSDAASMSSWMKIYCLCVLGMVGHLGN